MLYFLQKMKHGYKKIQILNQLMFYLLKIHLINHNKLQNQINMNNKNILIHKNLINKINQNNNLMNKILMKKIIKKMI